MVRLQTVRRRRELLRRAQAHLGRAYRDPDLSLEDVARAVGTSTRQLQRAFREHGKESFRSYLLRKRMEEATRLLTRKENPLPVRAVAGRVGYSQASGLRQAFVRFYGYNPSEVQPEATEYLGTVDFGKSSVTESGTVWG